MDEKTTSVRSYPPLLGVGALLGESREVYERQQDALALAGRAIADIDGTAVSKEAATAAVTAYLDHMRRTEPW